MFDLHQINYLKCNIIDFRSGTKKITTISEETEQQKKLKEKLESSFGIFSRVFLHEFSSDFTLVIPIFCAVYLIRLVGAILVKHEEDTDVSDNYLEEKTRYKNRNVLSSYQTHISL